MTAFLKKNGKRRKERQEWRKIKEAKTGWEVSRKQRRKNNEMLLVENRTFISVVCFKKEKKKKFKKNKKRWRGERVRNDVWVGRGGSGLVSQQTTAYTKITFQIPFTKTNNQYYHHHY